MPDGHWFCGPIAHLLAKVFYSFTPMTQAISTYSWFFGTNLDPFDRKSLHSLILVVLCRHKNTKLSKRQTHEKLQAAASLAALVAAPAAQADTSYMIGATWAIGGNSPQMGVLSGVSGSDFGFGGGVTYYVSTGMIGYDAIAAYMQNDIVLGGGYDFASFSQVFTLGYYQ